MSAIARVQFLRVLPVAAVLLAVLFLQWLVLPAVLLFRSVTAFL